MTRYRLSKETGTMKKLTPEVEKYEDTLRMNKDIPFRLFDRDFIMQTRIELGDALKRIEELESEIKKLKVVDEL